jgi:hypothetical protein
LSLFELIFENLIIYISSRASLYKSYIGDLLMEAIFMYSWTGDKALQELEEANISKQCFHILLECATKVSHLFDTLEYSYVCMLFDNLIIYQGNQSCYRLGNGCTAFKWHVCDNIGRFMIIFLCMHYIFQLFTYLRVFIFINDHYQSHFRPILITILFLL